jgi:hypothetical protein
VVDSVILHHPVALHRSEFWSFCAVHVQRHSLFFLPAAGKQMDVSYVGSWLTASFQMPLKSLFTVYSTIL